MTQFNLTDTARKDLESVFIKHDCHDFKWIDSKEIVVAQWVRVKCMYGCEEYTKNAACPPNAPSVSECDRFFKEYADACLIHFEKVEPDLKKADEWSRDLNLSLLELERDVFLSGYERAFLMFTDCCGLCDSCPGIRKKCKKPDKSRPTAEGFAVDVYSTVRKVGYKIEVKKDFTDKMDRYALLMIR